MNADSPLIIRSRLTNQEIDHKGHMTALTLEGLHSIIGHQLYQTKFITFAKQSYNQWMIMKLKLRLKKYKKEIQLFCFIISLATKACIKKKKGFGYCALNYICDTILSAAVSSW